MGLPLRLGLFAEAEKHSPGKNMKLTFHSDKLLFVRTKCLGPVSGAIMSSQSCLEAQNCNYILASF